MRCDPLKHFRGSRCFVLRSGSLEVNGWSEGFRCYVSLHNGSKKNKGESSSKQAAYDTSALIWS